MYVAHLAFGAEVTIIEACLEFGAYCHEGHGRASVGYLMNS